MLKVARVPSGFLVRPRPRLVDAPDRSVGRGRRLVAIVVLLVVLRGGRSVAQEILALLQRRGLAEGRRGRAPMTTVVTAASDDLRRLERRAPLDPKNANGNNEKDQKKNDGRSHRCSVAAPLPRCLSTVRCIIVLRTFSSRLLRC